MSKRMGLVDAKREAHRLLGTPGIAPGDRCGWASRRRTAPRFVVGFYVRGEVGSTIAGQSDLSWEDAFADAVRLGHIKEAP